jgi:hypothetical protein
MLLSSVQRAETSNGVWPSALEGIADVLRSGLAAHPDPNDAVTVVPAPR